MHISKKRMKKPLFLILHLQGCIYTLFIAECKKQGLKCVFLLCQEKGAIKMSDDKIIRDVLKGFYDNIDTIETLEILYKIRDRLEENLKLCKEQELYNFEVNYAIILQDFKEKLDRVLREFSELTELTELTEIKELINKLTKLSRAINYFNAI